MNEGTAIDIAKGKMKELGVGDDYIIRYRHLRLDPHEKIEIKAYNEYYILTAPHYRIKITSKTGIYDMRDNGLNEMQHMHSGSIQLQNQASWRLNIRFIQVIPLEKIKKAF